MSCITTTPFWKEVTKGLDVPITGSDGGLTLQEKTPRNVEATYPFQIVEMDHIPSLPGSHRVNTELLIWVDLVTGYVMTKASASLTAHTVAEGYEECVFCRFGASEAIRHDQEPGFMSDFFRAFSSLVGQRQQTIMAYRPQANGTAEGLVQTLTRSIKMYASDVGQQDRDDCAERLTSAMNTAQDQVRKETPFYLVHGWDATATLEATLPEVNTRSRIFGPRRWRYHIHHHYQRARAQVNENL
ncbi:unnamed protein product [Peronospora belbahrii]|uniref:Integrase catalytic domain-containing protein n=1 Tax=Peronospora belbahrii TaxID=622444 RepID=A0ABN8CZ57_9STRA|nr:unnamed protein product [Peronospora belbahrii]